MDIQKIYLVTFSPVFHSRNLGRHLAKAIAIDLKIAVVDEIDVTPYTSYAPDINFSDKDLVIFASPVYGMGRIPAPANQKFSQFKGNNALAILLLSYGNHSYGDAVLELYNLTVKAGFKPMAAAACIAEHVIAPEIARARPNADDIAQLDNFALQISQKLKNDQPGALSVPGAYPYCELKKFSLPQTLDDTCIHCGTCVELCPVNAIDAEDTSHIDTEKCICCMRCVYICPQKSRHPLQQFIDGAYNMLMEACPTPKDNEFFLSVD